MDALAIAQLEDASKESGKCLDTVVGQIGHEAFFFWRSAAKNGHCRMIVANPKVVILDEATSATG